MGLDNGICVRGKTRKELPKVIRYPFDKDYEAGVVDICYWRKCWDLRNAILDIIGKRFTSEEEWRFTLNCDDVLHIQRQIVYYLRHPNEWDNSIWTFKEIERVLRQDSWNLWWLWIWMKRHSDVEVYFYDSY